MGRRVAGTRRWAVLVGCVAMAMPFAAKAERPALVVVQAGYALDAALPACAAAVPGVTARLRAQGYSVTESIDASAPALQGAIDSFAARARLADGPPAVYLCARATAARRRLFLLPVDATIQSASDLPTRAILVKAFINALAGTHGMLVAELHLRPGADLPPALDDFRAEAVVPLHLALAASETAAATPLTSELTAGGPGLDWTGDWDGLVRRVQARIAATQDAVTALFVPMPPPVPSAPPQVVAAIPPPPVPAAPTPPQVVAVVPPAPPIPPAAPPHVADSTPSPPPALPTPSPAPAVPPGPMPVAASPPAVALPPLPVRPVLVRPTKQPRLTAPSRWAAPGPVEPSRLAIPPSEQAPRLTRIKVALMARGFYSGPVNGEDDPRTQSAVRAYQSSIGHPASGALTPLEVVTVLNGR